MCHFVSWIQKGRTVLFLTDNDVFNTKDGKALQEYCGNNHDLIGHGAIRKFYGDTAEGRERECISLSRPDRFPKAIQRALLAGKMNRLAKIGGRLGGIYSTTIPLTRAEKIKRIMKALPKDPKIRKMFKDALNRQKTIKNFGGEHSPFAFISTREYAKNRTAWNNICKKLHTDDFDHNSFLFRQRKKPVLNDAWRAAKKKLFPKKK